MAAVTAPASVGAQHQSLLPLVGEAAWSAKVREMVLPAIERRRPIEAWIIDDTAFPTAVCWMKKNASSTQYS
jgi:SRSO17 transposase